ncbi:SDR family oxidoreductase [Xanthomonas campestris]|uniref:SDR family oxidoreductase n=1 Tax=Xanthomonas campestris TaxID=339 RepID=UPI003CEFE85C
MYLARDLGPRSITGNTVAPGAIATGFPGGAVRDTPAYTQAFADMTALGRVGVPDDIGPDGRQPVERGQPLGHRAADRGVWRPDDVSWLRRWNQHVFVRPRRWDSSVVSMGGAADERDSAWSPRTARVCNPGNCSRRIRMQSQSLTSSHTT